MLTYRCKCGELTGYGSMPMPRCLACSKCGSDMATGPDFHREPLPHEYTSHVEQMGVDGPVQVPVCRYCHRPQWEIERESADAATTRQGEAT